MPSIFFEDFSPGQKTVHGPFRMSKDLLVDFARRYDPQPFHLDEEAAKATLAGRLIASGWQSCGILMRIIADGFMNESSSCGSPGIEEVKWIAPVLPDDVLSARVEVLEVKASKSKPDIGLVKFRLELVNQSDKTVLVETAWVIFSRRGAIIAPMKRQPETGFPHPPSLEKQEDGSLLAYLEDLSVGEENVIGSYAFPADEIVAFARLYDPQPFHLDEDLARRSLFGGLCASGWHTAAGWMRCMAQTRKKQSDRAAALGKPVPQLGPSPGFKNLKWLKPVYAGDVITYTTTVTGWRPSASKPGWGLAFHRNTGTNQRGELAFEFEGSVFWQSRPSR